MSGCARDYSAVCPSGHGGAVTCGKRAQQENSHVLQMGRAGGRAHVCGARAAFADARLSNEDNNGREIPDWSSVCLGRGVA